MFKLKKVEIDGFWYDIRLKSSMEESVNIFIGKNGTGKTTYINILQGVLSVDLALLETLQFDEVRIWLVDGRKRRKISVKRISSETILEFVKFQIGTEVFELPLISNDSDYRRRIQPRYLKLIETVRTKMSSLVNISWLSVHREQIDDDEQRAVYTRRYEKPKNPIDLRLDGLIDRLISYQLSLQSESSKISAEFQKNVLVSMLYKKSFDSFDERKPLNINLDSTKERLLHVYEELGALDDEVSNVITEHIDRLKASTKKLTSRNSEGTVLVDDVLPISLLYRTLHIIDLSKSVDESKRRIFNPLNTYLKILQEYLSDKTISLGSDLSDELRVHRNGKQLPIKNLSSGEKQLLILLTETLLQRQEKFIFIADEPELSLHIEWQREIISSIKRLNSNAQVIVATHSPEIAGKWSKNITDMEEIIYE